MIWDFEELARYLQRYMSGGGTPTQAQEPSKTARTVWRTRTKFPYNPAVHQSPLIGAAVGYRVETTEAFVENAHEKNPGWSKQEIHVYGIVQILHEQQDGKYTISLSLTVPGHSSHATVTIHEEHLQPYTGRAYVENTLVPPTTANDILKGK